MYLRTSQDLCWSAQEAQSVWGGSLQETSKETSPYHDSTLAMHILADVST